MDAWKDNCFELDTDVEMKYVGPEAKPKGLKRTVEEVGEPATTSTDSPPSSSPPPKRFRLAPKEKKRLLIRRPKKCSGYSSNEPNPWAYLKSVPTWKKF